MRCLRAKTLSLPQVSCLSFRMQPLFQIHFSCLFVCLFPAQPKPEVIETPQQVLARAAAKGLLDGLQLNQPIRKEGRGRRSRRAPANQKHFVKTRPRATQSNQSRVAEFLSREMKGSSSEPTLIHENGRTASPRSPAHHGYFSLTNTHNYARPFTPMNEKLKR